MKLPAEVNISGVVYRIEYYDDSRLLSDRKAFGVCDHEKRLIRLLRGELALSAIWATLLHEVFHAIADEFKLDWLDGSDGHEEERIALLSNVLMDTFVRNGWLKLSE